MCVLTNIMLLNPPHFTIYATGGTFGKVQVPSDEESALIRHLTLGGYTPLVSTIHNRPPPTLQQINELYGLVYLPDTRELVTCAEYTCGRILAMQRYCDLVLPNEMEVIKACFRHVYGLDTEPYLLPGCYNYLFARGCLSGPPMSQSRLVPEFQGSHVYIS
jgi:hypothetical protein